MLVQGLSNTKDGGGVTGMALYSNKGALVATYPMPTTDGGDGYATTSRSIPRRTSC